MGTYAEMATLTAISRATLEGYTDTMQNYGYDLAIISSHEDACPICAAWQGVVVSVSGRDRRHLSLDDARDAGVFHPRCLHHISIYREGITHGEARDRPRPVQDAGGGYTGMPATTSSHSLRTAGLTGIWKSAALALVRGR